MFQTYCCKKKYSFLKPVYTELFQSRVLMDMILTVEQAPYPRRLTHV